MASVDEIFKTAGLPNKRKLEAFEDPGKIYKASKLNVNDSTRYESIDANTGGTAPEVVKNQNSSGENSEQSLLMQKGDTKRDEVGDVDEGRFFGGGITTQESRILDFVEDAGETDQALDKIDIGWVRKTASSLEKRISKNAELRAKHENDPHKFIASEADLDSEIKILSIVSEHPHLYESFVSSGCLNSLVGLLAHENTDIAIGAMEIIDELTDEDVAATNKDWNVLADALIDADLSGLLVSNLSRLDENDEADRGGVYHVFSILENLCSRASIAARIGKEDGLLKWMLSRLQRQETSVSQNTQYVTEMLAILSQASPEAREHIASLEALDIALQLVAPYRREDPQGGSEEEYMQNLFEALTCLVDGAAGKYKFIEAEGVELCLIMLKDGKMSRMPALRLLDHACGGHTGGHVCLKVVEAGGLKIVFSLFAKTQDRRLLVLIINIFASMLGLIPADSPERIRTLAKFVEKDYRKLTKLAALRGEFEANIDKAEADYRAQPAKDADEAAVELLSRKFDAGLHTLQQIDVVLAWLIAEDGGAGRKIRDLLKACNRDISHIAATMKEQKAGLDTDDEETRDFSDMLGALLDCLPPACP